MQKPKGRHVPRPTSASRPGEVARAKGRTLNSCRIGGLPIVDRILQRIRLEEFLRPPLVPAWRRSTLPDRSRDRRHPPAKEHAALPLARSLGEWSSRFDPKGLGFADAQLPSLNDDRVGRCLDRLFRTDVTSLVLALATHAVREFQVDLDELHNDFTTITFHGDYADAAQEEKRGEATRMAITWGYNKDHRPDLKQLLYILTVSRDGAVPSLAITIGNVPIHIVSF